MGMSGSRAAVVLVFSLKPVVYAERTETLGFGLGLGLRLGLGGGGVSSGGGGGSCMAIIFPGVFVRDSAFSRRLSTTSRRDY